MSDDRLEAERLQLLADLGSDFDGDLSGFEPGTLGCHEAMHMASIYAEDVLARLAEHPAVAMNREWHRLAMEAGETLFRLYQAIGAAHLDEHRSEGPRQPAN